MKITEEVIRKANLEKRKPYEDRKRACNDFAYTMPGPHNLVMGQYCTNSVALEEGTPNCAYNCEHGYCPFGMSPLPYLVSGRYLLLVMNNIYRKMKKDAEARSSKGNGAQLY